MLSDLRHNSGTMSGQHWLTAPAARSRSDLAGPLAPLPRFDHVGNTHLEPSRCLTRAQLVRRQNPAPQILRIRPTAHRTSPTTTGTDESHILTAPEPLMRFHERRNGSRTQGRLGQQAFNGQELP